MRLTNTHGMYFLSDQNVDPLLSAFGVFSIVESHAEHFRKVEFSVKQPPEGLLVIKSWRRNNKIVVRFG